MQYTDKLESPRLTTRFLTPADADLWVEYCNDPIATTFTAMPGNAPEEMAQAWIGFCLKRYEENRGGLQALISRDTGELVGQCGLFIQEVNGKAEIEVGYHLLRRHWGRGYATEAATLFRNYGFENDIAGSFVSIIDPLNEASKKVALRNGMQLADAAARFRGGVYNLFRITRSEWEAVHQGLSP